PQGGVMVAYSGGRVEAAEADARGIAMQLAAMRPRSLTRDQVPEEVVGEERRIAAQGALGEGKPEAAIPRIVEGKVNAFCKDTVLLDQQSVVEPKKSVSQILAEAGLTVTSFVRIEVGQD